MKISYNWLKQFIQLDWEAPKTGELLTDLGLEVEGIQKYESVKGGLSGVVVGHVLTCVQHPNADRLKLTTVDIGLEEPVQIVCGAPNVDAGQKVPVATVGTTLYTAEGEPWKIKKGKIRGEVSMGMICAEDELGLGKSHDGIMILEPSLEPGTPCATIFEIENDEIFEIGLTPNRSDAMSHMGVARDLKAGLEQQEIFKELITPSVSNFNIDARSFKIDVDVLEPKLAPRYCGITIKDVLVQDSPSWLKNKLKAIGLSPINNIVDITNYVLHELGQPLHAFDASKIKGNKVEVKTLAAGTKFVTLDGVERSLDADDLMICDVEKPLCIAGVFGGLQSGVTEHTTTVFLESAYFDPVSIRKTAKRHALNTDASFRYERGIDINLTKYALKRAAMLIKEIAGGEFSSEIADLYPIKKEDYQVFLTFEKINKLIGENLPKDTIKSILAALEIKVNNVTETGLGLTIPSYRTDVQREVDVIEEILRVYGYNNIGINQKITASVASTSKFDNHRLQNIVGNYLAANGYYEIMTNSLVPINQKDNLGLADSGEQIRILNPLSADLSKLRESLLFSGLETVAYNHNRKQGDLRLFEFGKTYKKNNDTFKEQNHLGLFLTGNQTENNWLQQNRKSDFFYLKSVAISILERLGISNFSETPTTSALFSEGLDLINNDKLIVSFGLIKKPYLKESGIKSEVLYADFNWDIILELVKTNDIKYKEVSKFPEVKRDFALLLDDKVTFKDIYSLANETEKKLLKEVSLFDVYTGTNLPEGKKSYAVSFTLLDENKTLTDKQIDKIMGKLEKTYADKLGASLR